MLLSSDAVFAGKDTALEGKPLTVLYFPFRARTPSLGILNVTSNADSGRWDNEKPVIRSHVSGRAEKWGRPNGESKYDPQTQNDTQE